ncbi:cAMP-binding domain of CRP or a regulatory subunit of cAMP-dependent protein kinases [Pedobacter westerhofensis]|uniref:cAMP-binding domain of CRP or a regulatory subunit of cAMP-dependent protein kinases n=1 Tax=Pedobacter westerhofensis TaxID=425512 RepID=A0A521ADR8_9SPHI|nr:Crp/Fnr family transcriptional regulator [Pedobacter westerhofensis]SMO32963.1 cAMP-binding domain of CRP or a regulatory subunit of cAMP-dependent protein kinases [Pedobacter westerhofensis]
MKSLLKLFTEDLKMDVNHFEKFTSQLKLKKIKKKDHLLREGSVCNFIGFVSSGVLRSYVNHDNGQYNNDFYFENDIASAYDSFLTQMPSDCNIEALTECSINCISYEKLHCLIKNDNAFLKLSKYISDFYFIRKCKREMFFLNYPATVRLERMSLLYPGIEQRVSQYHIASFIGVKPESLSRIKLLTYVNK